MRGRDTGKHALNKVALLSALLTLTTVAVLAGSPQGGNYAEATPDVASIASNKSNAVDAPTLLVSSLDALNGNWVKKASSKLSAAKGGLRLLQASESNSNEITFVEEPTGADVYVEEFRGDGTYVEEFHEDGTVVTEPDKQDDNVVVIGDSGAGEGVEVEVEDEKAPETATNDTYSWPASRTQTVTDSEGNFYTVTVTFGESAGVPYEAELMVSSLDATDGRISAQHSLVGLGADERAMHDAFVEVKLVDGGQVVIPTGTVEVTIETNAINQSMSDAVEVASTNAHLTTENASGAAGAGNTSVRFNTDTLGEFGLTVVERRAVEVEVLGEKIVVWAPRSTSVRDSKNFTIPDTLPSEGVLKVGTLNLYVDPTRSWPTTLFVTTERDDESALANGLILTDEKSGALVFGVEGTEEPVAISPEDGAFVVEWDTGMRTDTLSFGDIEITGPLPIGAQGDLMDVRADYPDGESVTGNFDGVKFAYDVIGAYDLSFQVNGTAWTPDKQHPQQVTIHGIPVRKDHDVQVWHASDGSFTQIEDSTFEDGSMSFTAADDGVYVLIDKVSLEREFTATDNETYRMTVSYDGSAGLPRDVYLEVTTRATGGSDYLMAMIESAQSLGKTAKHIAYAQLFDIALVDPLTGARYQPTENVSITIELISAEKNEEDALDVVGLGNAATPVSASADATTVEFAAADASTYAVVVSTVDKVVTASDGKTYQITVSYDSASGIPANASLDVKEITDGDAGYEEYKSKSAEAMGASTKDLAYARAFDISLVDPETGATYQPTKDVEVSIQVLDDNLNNYANVDVVHFRTSDQPDVMGATVEGDSVAFTTDGFSVYVVCGYTVDFHWRDYTYSIAGESEILLSELLDKLGVTEIAISDVTDVTFSNPDYVEIQQTDSDWQLNSLKPFTTEETLTLELEGGQNVQIKVTDEGEPASGEPTPKENLVYNGGPQELVTAGVVEGTTYLYALGENSETAPEDDAPGQAPRWGSSVPERTDAGTYFVWYAVEGSISETAQCLTVTISPATFDPRVSMTAGEYDKQNETISYTVVVEADGNSFFGETDHPVTISCESSNLTFDSGSYTYNHKDGFAPNEGETESQIGGANVSQDSAAFDSFPLVFGHMYDGDKITLTYTAKVDSLSYNVFENKAQIVNTVTIAPNIDPGNQNITTDTTNDQATVTSAVAYAPLTREYVALDGSWAYWRVVVNPKGYTLGEGDGTLTLTDTFDDGVEGDAGQSIDYSSVTVSNTEVTYDYSGNSGTFVIPDKTPVTISYRTRVAAEAGAQALFRGTAVLKDADDNTIASATAGVTDNPVPIYPSPSDVGGLGDKHMVKLFVYAEGEMQKGIEGAQFILLDANQRALEYKVGGNKGDPVTFTTGADGYVDIELEEEAGDISIEKNTGYYLEMIKAVEGYQKDNTLYSFMITDDPNYVSGGFYKYYNGDTMKVRLYPVSAGLSVSIRFSGSYALREDQQNGVEAVLQKMDDQTGEWVEVERHPYSDSRWGSIKFDKVLYDESLGAFQTTYRVVEENQHPWDLPDDIYLVTTYYSMVGTSGSDPHAEPQEFDVKSADESVSVVIDNRYEEPQLTIVKMDKSTGELLSGAEFSVYKIVNGEPSGDGVKTYTTDENGEMVVRGGEPYESETLYGVKETKAPAHYLMPLEAEWHYFYFCNDDYLEPRILANLPEDATAVNLTNSGDRVTIDNQKELIDIPVMKIWQGGTWPKNTEVEVGLYQSVDGGDAEAVLDENNRPRHVTLSSTMPYNNKAFTDLPSRDGQGRTITYSIKEEGIDGKTPLEAGYVQEYGVSSAGVYIVRNKPATSLTVSKEWYDASGAKVTSEAELAEQSSVTFDVYRSPERLVVDDQDDRIDNAEMTALTANLVKVREGLTFGADDEWFLTIDDLDKQDDLGKPYYYYVLETVPSFGNETYEVDGETGAITIKNKVAPEAVDLTVAKAELKDDPRPESLDRDFEFTLQLKADETHPIRKWQVYTDADHPENNLVTDWDGKVAFKLKPKNPDQPETPEASITLALPAGVTATVTEAYSSEYTVETDSAVTGTEGDNGRTYSYQTSAGTNATLTYTNTLRVVCKVIPNGDNSEPLPFESLSRALAYLRDNPSDFSSPWTIYLLEDYTIPTTDVVDVKVGESLVLTTADKTDGMFPFRPSDDDPERNYAIITRGGTGESMLKNAGKLTLQNICLDGAKDSFTATGDGGLVSSTGTLSLNEGTTLRNSVSDGKGGAIYAENMVTIADGVAITNNSAPNASALFLRGKLTMKGGSITDNTGAEDGAVVASNASDVINLSGNSVIFDNTNAQGKAANLSIGVDSDNIVNVVAPGLGEHAHIGISAMDGHMQIGEQFATAENDQTANLNSFINDAFGYRGKLKDGTATNVVWNGLKLTLKKVVDTVGANPNDRFTITLTSPSILTNTYTIDGTLDYTVTAARGTRPGRIVFRQVKAGDVYTITPLPVGTYTITEEDSNYRASFTQQVSGGDDAPIRGGSFEASDDCTVTVTNTRRLAEVNLTKTLEDELKETGEEQDFNFTVKLTEADGSAVKGFELAEGITTNNSGEATFTMSPQNNAADGVTRKFKAPVGAKMTITEASNQSYHIVASAKTMPSEDEGEPEDIEDEDADNANVFAFPVTDDGADVIFRNKRKMADITLSKTVNGKVSKTESYKFTVTLTRADGNPAANYTMYEDIEDPTKNITTDANGKVTIPFTLNEGESSKFVSLTIPEGTKMLVAETDVNNNHADWYNTTYSLNGAAAQVAKTVSIQSVSDNDKSIAFTNTRKTQKATVSNTVNGYSGNVVPFTFVATVTDGGENDYDANGFTDGEQTFELATGQSRELTVPYGSNLTVAEGFIVGYDTSVTRGSAAALEATQISFDITADETLAFSNTQLIGLQIVNKTSATLENVQVYVGYGTRMYRVNETGDGQERIEQTSGRWATLSVEAGKTAQLEINHTDGITSTQDYTVKGNAPKVGYLYTINNEPSYHEYADPAYLRVYNTGSYQVKGKLRYSTVDSIVTFTEQPLVSFDSNGGVWTTEMEGYHDRDGNRKVYQKAVNSGETVACPTPAPVYPTAEGIEFLGWTMDETFAKDGHSAGEDISAKAYDFDTSVTAPITLYAVWAKPVREYRVVTVKNELDVGLTVTAVLSQGDTPISGHALVDDLTTDENGQSSFPIPAGESKNLNIPNSAKLVLNTENASLAVSSEYTLTASADNKSHTIASVERDGTVTFIPGICKITDSDGNVLYDGQGKPAVYGTLEAAFTAYAGTLYTDASHETSATQAAVKMLVDEYGISKKHTFPNKTMTLTTAGKDDEDFPFSGKQDRATLYRGDSFTNDNLFAHNNASETTLTGIILDGRNVPLGNINGGLINLNNGGAKLIIGTGTTMRNVTFAAYTTNSRGGAIYISNGTLNINSGLFSNLHAKQGGAICVAGGTLSIEGTGIRFENCIAEQNEDSDGGAIYYNVGKALTIDGGTDKDNPGVVFQSCVALGNNLTGKDKNKSSGGAIYATTSSNHLVSISGCSFIECSARTTESNNAGNGGGAICANGVSGLTVSCCKFDACDTLSRGGAVVANLKNGGIASFTKTTFDRCSCKGQGGAVAVYQPLQEKTEKDAGDAVNAKLIVSDSSFANCSSGTDNGSGGAIQCYLPLMEFTDSTFTDCWAGKEGGAINNYFANGYTAVWSGTYMNMTGCTFIRCRAEDRYQAEQPQHYGGGINTKVKTVTITNSNFVDCVSTLREGGALHLGGQGSGSIATITDSTFKNCTAKTGGGAVMASTETLKISSSFFYGCQAFGEPAANYVYNNNNKKNQNGGGAISHSENSRGTSTQKTTLIKDCVFSAGPNGGADAHSCSTATNGGAIWTRGQNVTISDCTIDGCLAGGNGGGVYLSKNSSQTATLTGNTAGETTAGTLITNCKAKNGSAVYVEDKATFSSVTITENVCSNVNSGAIQGGTLYFEGVTVVRDNTCSDDSEYKHDVLLQNDNNTTIYTTADGLDGEANIGVYVADPNKAYANHGKEGLPFGTYGSGNGTANLENFFNNRDEGLFGYEQGDGKIYWGRYLCKITDANGYTLKRANGKDAVYQRLTMALNEFTSVVNDDGEAGKAKYIKILVEEYNIFQTGQIENFPAADVTLTTATKDEPDGKHPYRGTAGTVCTISRNNSDNQLFKLNNANATFQLENITLDGRRDKSAEEGKFRLIEAVTGRVIINGGTTLQYGSSGHGGAIYAQQDAAPVTINGSYDEELGEPAIKFLSCRATGDNNGGAINARKLTITNNNTDATKYGTAFIDCYAARGGAVCVNGDTLNVAGALVQNCHCNYEGGAFYHNNEGNHKTVFDGCAFIGCYTGKPGVNGKEGNDWSYGGAICSMVYNLEVKNSSFTDCYALSDGGAVNHGARKGDRTETILENSTFTNCQTTGSYADYSHGGAVSTRAKTVSMTDSSFENCTATNNGGAFYSHSSAGGSKVTVSGTVFEGCSVTKNAGRGGAICSRGKELALGSSANGNKTSISSCLAKGFSGAVHMETDDNGNNVNLVLNISDNTVISGCYANQGGAIYLKSGVTLNLTDSPEFSQNGYTTSSGSTVNAAQGACIYLVEGSKINLAGSPKFSRNILPNLERITNGGIYDYVRQDIYLAGYANKSAASIYVVGELTGDTIWVWPEKEPHKLANDQFAKIALASGVTLSEEELADTLSHFRNSLADSTTGCSNGEYLAGVKIGNDSVNVYWDKMYTVSFKKIDNKGVAVPGAGFTLYKDAACTAEVATAVSADGESDTDAQGNLMAKGKVEFASVRIGAYYMKETQVPASFKENNTIYLVLVGSPYLSKNEANISLWEGNGPLDVDNAATLVARHTTDSGKFYGIFPLNESSKAILSANLASNSVGIINIRNDYQAYFMKVDGSGYPLPGAAFTIYTAIEDAEGNPRVFEDGYPMLKLWSRDGETYPGPVESADGTTAYRDVNNKVLPKGLVYFRELPLGTYYLLETAYPGRNGDGRRTFYAESDRVFKLDIVEGETQASEVKVTLSEWHQDSAGNYSYEDLSKDGNDYYVVANKEVVCKITDANDNLFYTEGHAVWERNEEGPGTTRLMPAIYSTLEEGFAAAQKETFVDEDGTEANADALKLKMLKDFTISEPIVYNSPRDLTFTTAETRAQKDRYVFITTRTSDTSRAEVKRAYTGDALITVSNDPTLTEPEVTKLTLQNINLNGDKTKYDGRAIHVTSGELTVRNNTLIQKFKQTSGRGGAILMDGGTSLAVNGGSNRSAVFSNNEVTDSAGGDGGAIVIGKNCSLSLTNAQFTSNKASSGNGGALHIDARDETAEAIPITNVVYRSNTGKSGGAVYAGENANLTVEANTFTSNQATDESGGALMIGRGGKLTIKRGSFSGNKASKGDGGAVAIGRNSVLTIQDNAAMSNNTAARGGAVYVAPTATATIESGIYSGNKASSNGGAVYVAAEQGEGDDDAKIGTLTLTGGSFTGNTAVLGSAVYTEDYGTVNLSSVVITDNTTSGENGGAINFAGGNARLYLTGSPVVFNNTDVNAKMPQRNVVLSVDSNQVINTGENGLNGGIVGVYVIDGDDKSIFTKHGLQDTPFGTFGDIGHANSNVFYNDRNLALRAVSKSADDKNIYWDEVVCKLTDNNDTLLYQTVKITVNGKAVSLLAPAAYKTLENGFKASGKDLHYMNGGKYTGSSAKVKMLKDYALDKSHDVPTKLTLTLTTAETTIASEKTNSDGDTMPFITTRSEDGERAYITRAFEGDSLLDSNSMFEVGKGSVLTLAGIVLDGKKDSYIVSGDGGIVTVLNGGKLNIADGAKLTNAKASGNGGAIFVSASGSTVTLAGGEMSGNEASNGGAIYVKSSANAVLTGGEIKGNEADKGGALYVEENVTATIKNGASTNASVSITDNVATTIGAAIYLAEGSKLELEGNPGFGNNTVTDMNYPGEPAKTNGGEPVYADGKLRQDIFLAGYFGKITAAADAQAVPATSIVVTGNITSGNGAIWVWAEKPAGDQPDNHYESLKQFAVIKNGTSISAASYLAFRNAQDDGVTLCGAEYLTGEAGDEMVAGSTKWKTIRWKGGGYDFSFKKIDGFGAGLADAEFTLYKGYEFDAEEKTQTLVEPLGKAPAKSDSDGIVLFEKAPLGIYFMLESTVPGNHVKTADEYESGAIYTKSTASAEAQKSVGVGPTVYVVLLGEAALKIPETRTGTLWASVLEHITEASIKVQTGDGANAKNYAIFKIDPDTGRAVTTPDIASYGIMNMSDTSRKVILRKVKDSDNASLEGAEFEVLRADRSLVSSVDLNGKRTTTFASDANGVYFVDTLPYGAYYLHEKKNADGKVVDLWFTLTVSEDGVGYKDPDENDEIVNRLVNPSTTAP